MSYTSAKEKLVNHRKRWLITGVAGFIGSNLLEELLNLEQDVIGVDNFATGSSYNLEEVQRQVSADSWRRFTFVEGDVCDYSLCESVVDGVDYVLHQAALGSVPRSIAKPLVTNEVNVTGFVNMLEAARNARVVSFTYAASSSTYGDHPDLPKVEDKIGNPLSPYAVTKYVNELYAGVYARTYGFKSVGLRYFNVFGRRQDPEGPYAAVIPKWIRAMLEGGAVSINGDGLTSRDFCYIENVVQMNILAATAGENCKDNIYNVAVGGRTSLNSLFEIIKHSLDKHGIVVKTKPIYKDFRPGDVKHSQANISKSQRILGYSPTHDVVKGIEEAMPWYIRKFS